MNLIRAHLRQSFAQCLVVAVLVAAAMRTEAENLSGWSVYNFPTKGVSSLSDYDLAAPLGPPNTLRMWATSQPVQATPQLVKAALLTANTGLTTRISLTNFVQGSLTTLASSPNIVIDLGQLTSVHRLFLSGTNHDLKLWGDYNMRTNPPLGLIVVSIGNSITNVKKAAEYTIPYDAGNPVDTEADFRFSPIVGRYITIELQTNVIWGTDHWPGQAIAFQPQKTFLALNLERLEVFGSPVTNLGPNAVVCPSNAPMPLALAARELSYYLGELTGLPHPIITPDKTNLYSGTIYRIIDLKSLASTYATMMTNIANGYLPGGVNIELQGREVVFRAWPYRCLLWSVWEFLERQGVRWVYPNSHGDFVPTGQGISLTMLPLRFTPIATSIFAAWGLDEFLPWRNWITQPPREEYLYAWRNRWNAYGGGSGSLGGAEIPVQPSPKNTLDSNYTESFTGYPHNFSSVIPTRILLQHTNWWGYSTKTNKRISPLSNNASAFCMSNPELTSWVKQKLFAVSMANPIDSTSPLTTTYFKNSFNLLPSDSTSYCMCDNCLAANDYNQASGIAWVKICQKSFSGIYYDFVNRISTKLATDGTLLPLGVLAYADVLQPPTNIGKLSNNVHVAICIYGSPNLPTTSPRNANLKQVLDTWHTKADHLNYYDYALLHTDYWQTNASMPVPLVYGIVERAKYLAQIGSVDGLCQATESSIPYNPWNFYAYPRIHWNTNQTSDQLLQEFFQGYFRDVSALMLAYYKTMEDYHVTNDVDLHLKGYCYGMTAGSFPISVLAAMGTNLATAENATKDWIVRQRLRKIREGYDWLISSSGLAGQNLNVTSIYSQVRKSVNFTVSLQNLKTPYAREGNGAIVSSSKLSFWCIGRAEVPLYFASAGDYRVVFAAKAVANGTVWPECRCYVGPKSSVLTINSSTNRTYSFPVFVSQGVWNLGFALENNGGDGKNAVIDINSIQLTSQ